MFVIDFNFIFVMNCFSNLTFITDLTLATNNDDVNVERQELEDMDEDEEDEDQEEEDPFSAFKQANLQAAKEREALAKQKEKELPAPKKQRMKGPQTMNRAGHTAQGEAPVAELEPPQPPSQQQRQRNPLSVRAPGQVDPPQNQSTPLPAEPMVTMTESSLERMLTRIVGALVPNPAQSSFVEAIEKQTDALSSAVKSSSARLTEEVEKEPSADDKSWWMTLDAHSSEDNSQTKLDWVVRNQLRAPNAEPKSYWSEVANKVTPVRGTSLYLTHVNGGEGIHPMVIRLIHDRTQHISVK